MSMHSSVRRSLRKITAFRSLPADRLQTVASRMICKEYRPGDVIWRTGNPTDFLGIVQRGELLIERRSRGALIHSTRLSAGDPVSTEKLSAKNKHSLVLVRALSNAQIQVLPALRSEVPQWTIGLQGHAEASRRQLLWVGWLWPLLVAAVLFLLSWMDIARITSGALFLLANPAAASMQDEGRRMALLDYAEAVDGSAAFAPNRKGYLLFQDQNLGEAAAAFAEAVRRNPAGSAALNNLAVVCFLTGQNQRAIELEEKAVHYAPDDPLLRYNLGLALVATDREKEALREFMQASYIDPAWALPQVQRAYLYLQLQDYAKAGDAAGEAVRLDASQEAAHLIRAIALYNQGKYLGALGAVQNALRLDPEDKIALFYKAMILSGLGRFDPALAILDRLLNSTKDPAEIVRITTEIEAVHHFQQESLAGTP